jgi:hypothetical protein
VPTSRDRRIARVGAWIALVVSIALVLRVIAIDNAEAIVIVAPAFAGGLLVLAWPQMLAVLLTALVLTGITATLSLIGGIGLFYVPSMILIGVAAVRTAHGESVRA